MAHRADLVRLVGFQPVERVSVLVGEDGNGPSTELVRGTECTDGDLSAIGDQNLAKHALHLYWVRGRCIGAARYGLSTLTA